MTTFATDDERWTSMATRDPRADGSFVYAVRTTGIYCRPSCGSRVPLRSNVAFFEGAEAAERAGYRACKRCRPGGSRRTSEASLRACRIIEAADRPPTLARLAAEVGMSPSRLAREFVRCIGIRPKEYVMAVRDRRLREALTGGETVAGAILGAGYGSIGRGYDGAVEALGGLTPARFRSGAEGESIRFASAETSIGQVLVAATEVGPCSIELGDSEQELLARLESRFPRADLAPGGEEFEGLLRRVVALIERPGEGFDLPIDVRGTAFQRRVWDALRVIPPGSTASYADVARSIGAPSAARAVARACASNTLAVAIPCHRVVRGNGGLGGFRWGIERKRALLDIEATDPVPPAHPAD